MVTVSSSTLSSNSATTNSPGGGGGIYNENYMNVSNSTLSYNSGGNDRGGGIYNYGGELSVSNSTLSGNFAPRCGGIYNYGGTLTVSSSTLSDNSTRDTDAGGINNYDSYGDSLTINNSIVANSRRGVDVLMNTSTIVGSNNLFGSVPLGTLQDNGGPTQTQALPAGSPAIDAGNNALAPATDQRGYPFLRIFGASVDIGAFEVQPPPLSVVGTQGDDTFTIDAGTQAGTFKTTVNGVVIDNITVDGGVFVAGLGGNDTITVTAAPVGGLVMAGGDASDTYKITLGNLAGAVRVIDEGTSGTDNLIITGTPGDDVINVKNGTVTWGNPVVETITYSGIESATVNGGGGNDTLIDPDSSNLTLLGGPGNDTIIIQDTTGAVRADGGAGSDTYIVNAGNLQGPVTIADTGTTGTDTVKIVGTPGDDAIVQNSSGFILNGSVISINGLEAAAVDGGGGAGDTFTVQGTPPLAATVQGVSDTVISGTAGDDIIRFVSTKNVGEVKAYLNGVVVGTFRPTGSLIAYGLDGDDTISADGVNIPVAFYGGDGNDTLTGGSVEDVIFGGSGDDIISGGAGNDFLIGGTGRDRIVGGAGNDILVSGDVDCHLNLAALRAISQAWASSRTVADDTVDDFLDEIFGDSSSDQLTGGAGADLFIINSEDTITDFQFGKPKTNKDGDVVIRNGVVTV